MRGDGVGYYAYIRSLLIEHKLDFANDWRAANESFSMGRVRPDGSINPLDYTRTGHLDNHFAVGPSILWAPFLVPVHYALLTLQRFGINVQANGYSRPYVVTMALATALYGFLGLLISFRLACLYTDAHWAFLANAGHLVREFSSGLHVLQSLLVARPVGFCRGAFSLVLATHPAGQNAGAVDNFRFVVGIDARRLLPEHRIAADPISRVAPALCGGVAKSSARLGRHASSSSRQTSLIAL